MPFARQCCRPLLVVLAAGVVGACSEPVAPEGQVRVEVTGIHLEVAGSIALDFTVTNTSSVSVRLFGCGAPFAPVVILRSDGTEDTSQQWCVGIQSVEQYPLAAGATRSGSRIVAASAGARYRLGVRFWPHASLADEQISWAAAVGPI